MNDPIPKHLEVINPWAGTPVRFDKSAWKKKAIELGLLRHVKDSTRLVLEIVLKYANPEGLSWCSRETLAAETGFKVALTSRAISELVAVRLLDRAPTRYQPNRVKLRLKLEPGLFNPADVPEPFSETKPPEPDLFSTPVASEADAQARTEGCAGAQGGVRARAGGECARAHPEQCLSKVSSDESQPAPPLPAAIAESSPPAKPAGGPWPFLLFAVERWKGARLTVSEEAIVSQYFEMLAQSEIRIHEAAIDPHDLFKRCVQEAIESHAEYKTIQRAMKYVQAVAERCLRMGLWPGEFDDGKPTRSQNRGTAATATGSGNDPHQRRSDRAAREFVETATTIRINRFGKSDQSGRDST